MPSTELLLRPLRHLWESPVAYVFRVASLNRTRYQRVVKKALDEFALAGQPLHEIWPTADHESPAREDLRLSVGVKARRPLRMVCPVCVGEGLPDSLYRRNYRYMEYCLRHGCRPLEQCPSCGIMLRYGSGSYGQCECGFELATACAESAQPEVLRLYRAIAANMPLDMTPTLRELERRDLKEMHTRLQSTWRLLWDDQPQPRHALEDPGVTPTLPGFGMRWSAVSCLLGVAEHRLGRWVTQIGCWWRHGRYRAEIRGGRGGGVLPTELILWRYLRELVRQAIKSGCSGPPMAGAGTLHACIGAGFQCKSRRSGLRGDRLPAPFRTTIGPCMKPFEQRVAAVVASSGCRPAANPIGQSQSLAEFNRLARGGARKVIELVAIGALQPIELGHPRAWRFGVSDVDDVLRQAFSIQLSRRVDGGDGAWMSFETPRAWLLAPEASMGGVFKALCFGLLKPVASLPSNIWATRFVNPGGMRLDAWAQRALHDAVLPSLEGRAREAALIAQSFLGGSQALHPNELELFCGMPPPIQKGESFTNLPYPPIPHGTGIPQNIAWREGLLYDSGLLATVTQNRGQLPVML